MLPVYDLSTDAGRTGYDQRLARLKSTASMASDAAETVARVVADVVAEGDEAVVRYMRRWTDPGFSADRIRVAADEFVAAEASLSDELRHAISASIRNVTEYQRHILPRDAEPVTIDGAELGLRWNAVDSAGCYVPGGTAVLFSTMIMTVVPALVAGVPRESLAVVCPPPTRRSQSDAVDDIAPVVLATAQMLGIEKVYRLGGAQAIAALAHGTETVERVDLIAGPGNVFVQLAKALVAGVVGTDNGFYGPSEIVTVADDSADPRKVAADLLAQAEHDPGKCFLVCWQRELIDAVLAELERQKGDRSRLSAIESALENESCALLVEDEQQAVAVANQIACEHVNLAVADPGAMLKRVRHAGEVFLGDATPVAAGDYYAGPSHCLPTGTTARFASGISVYTYLKRTGTVAYRNGMPPEAIARIAALAEAEGLDAHAASVRVRS